MKKIAIENLLESLGMPTVAEKQKSRGSPHKIEASDVIDFNETDELTVNTNSTKNNTQRFSTTYSDQTKIERSSVSHSFERFLVLPRFVPN